MSETEIPATELERAQAAPPPPPPPAPQTDAPAINAAEMTTAAASEPTPPGGRDRESKVMDQNWPFKGYDGPQPWEADNTPELTTNELMISPGGAGPEVEKLAGFLSRLGFSSSISQGQNPTNAYDDTVAGAVRAFCSEYGVEEDPCVIRARTPDTVGPWIWEALTRATYKAAAEEEQG